LQMKDEPLFLLWLVGDDYPLRETNHGEAGARITSGTTELGGKGFRLR